MPKDSQIGTTYVTSLNGKDLYQTEHCVGFSKSETEWCAEVGQCSKLSYFPYWIDKSANEGEKYVRWIVIESSVKKLKT